MVILRIGLLFGPPCILTYLLTYLLNYIGTCVILTGSTHAGVLSTDRTAARGAITTWRVGRQTRVVPIAISALVPDRAPTYVVKPALHAHASSAVPTRRRPAGFQLKHLAVGSRASGRASAAVPGTSWWGHVDASGVALTRGRTARVRHLRENHLLVSKPLRQVVFAKLLAETYRIQISTYKRRYFFLYLFNIK